MKIIISSGNQIGINKTVSDWNTNISQVSETLAEPANKTLANIATGVNYKCGGTLLLQTIRPIKKVMPILFSRRA